MWIILNGNNWKKKSSVGWRRWRCHGHRTTNYQGTNRYNRNAVWWEDCRVERTCTVFEVNHQPWDTTYTYIHHTWHTCDMYTTAVVIVVNTEQSYFSCRATVQVCVVFFLLYLPHWLPGTPAVHSRGWNTKHHKTYPGGQSKQQRHMQRLERQFSQHRVFLSQGILFCSVF